MLKRYATFFFLFRSIVDIAVIGCIWIAVYYIRFHAGLFGTPKGIPDFKRHLTLVLPVTVICYLSCLLTGLYKPKRMWSMFRHFIETIKTSVLAGLLLLALLYYLQSEPYSRILLILFVTLLFVGLTFSHLFTMYVMRYLRAKGYNLRYYVVIGAGKRGQQLVHDIEQAGWLGLKCRFFVDNKLCRIGAEFLNVPVYGPIEKLTELINPKDVDEVYLTLSGADAQAAYPLLQRLQEAGVTVRIVPDWGNLTSISKPTVVMIGSQILFSAADSPLNGVNIIVKEIFDRLVSTVLLIILAIPIGVIAALIKVTTKGPVFYKQPRIGLDQKEFEILKFRTMKANAENENGPQWAKPDDTRRTRIGAWLRKTSFDEMPQLVNVMKGEMSLVGPRPERTNFVEQFSEEYKKYMLRHKVKAGMTGWAQIHDFRGDTSISKRLQYDLYYVRNWSFGLDMWILLQTPWHIIKGKNAY
jgi:Undecaprenyl-phosphate glucose phosphotransferase